MTICEVPAAPAVHPALAGRFSPVGFDPEFEIGAAHVDSLLDAARMAPSAGNGQPWMFLVARRGDAIHRRLVPHLARSSSMWAPDASLLVVNCTQVLVEGTADWAYSEFAGYDLGQAVAHMTVQGLHLGLDAHQFRAFDRDALAAEFQIPPHWEATTMTAFGRASHAPGDVSSAGTSRERASRDEITWARD